MNFEISARKELIAGSRASTYLYGANVRANGIRQHFLRFGGEGAALVIVPGITSPAATWSFVAERLGTGFDTYVLDSRGRGLSEGGAHLAYDLEAYAADVSEFAGALGPDRYHLLGHSLGARIAARVGSTYPLSLNRLILADPPLSGPGRRPYGRSLAFYLESIREAAAGTLDLATMRRTYPNWGEANLRLRIEWLHTCTEAAIERSVTGFQEEEIQSDFPRIRAPTMLMVATRGGVILDEDVLETKTLMPSMEIARVEAGHMIPFDNLEGFLAPIGKFLGVTSF